MSSELEEIRRLRAEIDAQAEAARSGRAVVEEQAETEAPAEEKAFPWHYVGYGALGLAGAAVLLYLLKQLIVVAVIAVAGYVGYRWIKKSMKHDEEPPE